jgi:hypothetical protein
MVRRQSGLGPLVESSPLGDSHQQGRTGLQLHLQVCSGISDIFGSVFGSSESRACVEAGERFKIRDRIGSEKRQVIRPDFPEKLTQANRPCFCAVLDR